MPKAKTLSTKNLQELFGVTAMTIHNWKKRQRDLHPLPADPTPYQAEHWASREGRVLTCDPRALLGKDVLKPGPKPRIVHSDSE